MERGRRQQRKTETKGMSKIKDRKKKEHDEKEGVRDHQKKRQGCK